MLKNDIKKIFVVAWTLSLWAGQAHSIDKGSKLVGIEVARDLGITGDGVGRVVIIDDGIDIERAEFGSCSEPGKPASCRIIERHILIDNEEYTINYPPLTRHNGVTHATKVAAIILEMAPAAQIISLDVVTSTDVEEKDIAVDYSSKVDKQAFQDALQWVIDNASAKNIKFVNLSLASQNDPPVAANDCAATDELESLLKQLADLGVTIVAAAGNSGTPVAGLSIKDWIVAPACLPTTIAVGATRVSNGKVHPNSQSSNQLDLLAPGIGIELDGDAISGTSFSAAYVTGAMMLMAEAFPLDTSTVLKKRLQDNGAEVTDENTPNKKTIRIDLTQALPRPDLTRLFGNGWSGPIVVRNDYQCTKTSCNSESTFTTADEIVVSTQLTNIGNYEAIVEDTEPLLSLFVGSSRQATAKGAGIMPIGHRVTSVNKSLGRLPAGTHVITALLDHAGQLYEESTENNKFNTQITVLPEVVAQSVPPYKPNTPTPEENLLQSPTPSLSAMRVQGPTSKEATKTLRTVTGNEVTLRWQGGDANTNDNVVYTVWLEPDDDSPDTVVCKQISNTQCAVSGLIPGQKYYWQVYAEDNTYLTAISPVWEFETQEEFTQATSPTPADNRVLQRDELILRWIGGGRGDDASHTVFFESGDDTPDFAVCSNVDARQCYVEGLSDNEQYYWQVYSVTTDGQTTLSPVWTFSTSEAAETPKNPIPANTALVTGGVVDLKWDRGHPVSREPIQARVWLEVDDDTPDATVCNGISVRECSSVPLHPGKQYYWQVQETDKDNIQLLGPVWSFTTAGENNGIPTVVTHPADRIRQTDARLNGTFTPNGSGTTAYFKIGQNDAFDQRIYVTGVGIGTDPVSINTVVDDLVCGAEYQYRAYGVNFTGDATGEPIAFSTLPCSSIPTITTGEATLVTQTSARLNGEFNPNNDGTTAYFDLGAGLPYTTRIYVTGAGNGGNAVALYKDIDTLQCGTQYNYRAVGRSGEGEGVGIDRAFSTLPCSSIPIITTGEATLVTQTSVRLNGQFNPNNNGTTAYFDLGVGLPYSTRIYVTGAGNGGSEVALYKDIDTLQCGTQYNYRAVGRSGEGEGVGAARAFSTLPCDSTRSSEILFLILETILSD
ncbi:S8 family serine peptidase [Gammaproteobacteria bacterium]|nr:S8 family serine peptidase [Gammaproteobacteria bacterium]